MPTQSYGSVIVSLFFVMNVLGNIPLFMGLLAKYSARKRMRIMVREMIFALAILLIFIVFGDHLMSALGTTQSVIQTAGGLLLILIALGMIFPKADESKLPPHEPMIVPLAMPGIAGPGSIAAVMVFAGMDQFNTTQVVTATLLAWFPSVLILLSAGKLMQYIGEKGLIACERLGGMIITLIGVKMLMAGIIDFVKANFS